MQQSIFETERLYVRRFYESDEENFFLLNSDQDVMRYIRPVKDREESRHFLLENIRAYAASPLTGRWSVHTKADDQFVGTFAIIPLDNSSYWQVGYALLKEFWGKGYATELTTTGIRFAFRMLMVSKLAAVTEITNDASRRVLLKTGFSQLKNFIQDGKELCLFEIDNSAVIETERLLIAALDREQLDQYIAGNDLFEHEFSLKPTGREMSPEITSMIERVAVSSLKNATVQNYYFYTLWVVIDKSENRLVAELSFKGEPNARGEVEIGYGTFPECQREGLMTEAVGGLLSWTKNFPGIKSVTAETEKTNEASIKVLQKNGFQLTNKHADMLVWSVNVDVLS